MGVWLEDNAGALARFDSDTMAPMIRRCAELHMVHIAEGGDPFELGSARPLDYGHWAAHKLETLTEHRLRHGEAVAIGMALDARYAVLCGLLPPGEDVRIWRLLTRLGFRLWDPALEQAGRDGARAVIRGLEEFREHLGGELTVTLLNGVGRGVEVHEIDHALMLRAAEWLKQSESVPCD